MRLDLMHIKKMSTDICGVVGPK